MRFEHVLPKLRTGAEAYRKSWGRRRGSRIFYYPPTPEYSAYFARIDCTGKQCEWTPNQEDLLAHDWGVIVAETGGHIKKVECDLDGD